MEEILSWKVSSSIIVIYESLPRIETPATAGSPAAPEGGSVLGIRTAPAGVTERADRLVHTNKYVNINWCSTTVEIIIIIFINWEYQL